METKHLFERICENLSHIPHKHLVKDNFLELQHCNWKIKVGVTFTGTAYCASSRPSVERSYAEVLLVCIDEIERFNNRNNKSICQDCGDDCNAQESKCQDCIRRLEKCDHVHDVCPKCFC